MSLTIGQRITALREQMGWSKLELARRVGGKNPRTMVYRWESDKTIPTPESVQKLAEIFGCAPSALDPDGRAFTSLGRKRSTRLQPRHTHADSVSVAPTEEAGVLMEGGLPPVPDPELFGELLGVWRLLRGSEERRKYVQEGRRRALASEENASAPKKARR